MSNFVLKTSILPETFAGDSVASKRMIALRLILALALVFSFAQVSLADVVEQSVKDSKPSGLLAGAAKINIDPAVGTPHMSWGSATHLVSVAVDPVGLWMRALVLSDGKQKFALVDVDTAPGEDAIRRASEATGIPVTNIRVAIAHSHAGPSLNRNKGPVGADLSRYEKMMEAHRAVLSDKLVGVVVEANSKLRPVHAYGIVGTGSIAINRRFRGDGTMDGPPAVGLNPNGFTDRDLPVIRIDDAQGNPYAVLVNYQAHPTVLAYENKTASADWPGAMRKTVEENLPGATCLFFQGATGNQGPIEGFTGDLSVPHRLGAILGHEVTALALRTWTVRREPRFEGYTESTALQARQPHRVLGPHDATLRYTSKILELPRRVYTKEDVDRMAKLTADAEAKLAAVKKSGGSEWELSQAAARHRRWANLLARYQQPPNRTPVTLEIAALRIGDMALLMTQGELFSEIGAAIKKASPFKVTMICGYGSGRPGGGYMPVKSEYQYGSYEVDGTSYGIGAAEKVIEEAIALLKSIR